MRSRGWGHDEEISVLIRSNSRKLALCLSLPSVSTVTRWPSSSKEKNPHQEYNQLAPLSWTSQLQNNEKYIPLFFMPPSMLRHIVILSKAH